eukprot:CAMPEP_0178753292 /NCGR_PEP_ID=MMETSP0744-20121128/11533_1 /TAXON_ID=913974 /ORGANISM="Nitzschia punctata, Strain CCMP561" /LENGTH=107 /DNA_ID=CAMNT_0020407097 /DNA_START=54 /DNA_END=377 /DNA_ORIENTATION=+
MPSQKTTSFHLLNANTREMITTAMYRLRVLESQAIHDQLNQRSLQAIWEFMDVTNAPKIPDFSKVRFDFFKGHFNFFKDLFQTEIKPFKVRFDFSKVRFDFTAQRTG